MLPGLDGTGELFEGLADVLSSSCEIHFVRYGDYGSFEDLVDAAEAQLPTNRTFSLVAESFSGPVAMAILAKGRTDIGPSVLSATFSKSPFQSLAKLAKLIPDGAFGVGGLNQLALEIFGLGAETDGALKQKAVSVLRSVDSGTLKRRIVILSQLDMTEYLPRVDVPVLYIRATRDRIVSRAQGDEVVRSITNAKLTEVDGPHLILQVQPKVCAQEILAHVSDS